MGKDVSGLDTWKIYERAYQKVNRFRLKKYQYCSSMYLILGYILDICSNYTIINYSLFTIRL